MHVSPDCTSGFSCARRDLLLMQRLQVLGDGDECVCPIDRFLRCSWANMITEVVLITLLQHFKFLVPEDLEEPIFWNFGGVQWPSVGRKSDISELPLRVELVR